MLICRRCGEVTEEEHLSTYEEVHAWSSLGQPFAEKRVDYECGCGGTFVPARKCPICDEWYNEDEGSICDECLEKGETLENALKVGEEDYRDVRVNGFVKYYLNVDQINDILISVVKAMCDPKDRKIARYCELDSGWFRDWLEAEAEEKKGK